MIEPFVVLVLILGAIWQLKRTLTVLVARIGLRGKRKSYPSRTVPDVESRRAREAAPPLEPEFTIEYVDGGVAMQRYIAILWSNPRDRNHVRAWDFDCGEARTLRYNRIRSATDLRTGREISNLKKYLAG